MEPLLLGDDERAVPERWARRASPAQALALRARIVLACAGPDVPPIVEVARNLRISADTVRKWRRRFLAERLDGLADEPRPGRPPAISVDRVEAVVVATLEEIPRNATHQVDQRPWAVQLGHRGRLAPSTKFPATTRKRRGPGPSKIVGRYAQEHR
ncbi:helix-turn-helix domain-containing protein [Streptomyces sp. NPDC046931]|uniref:helix-turn-helix domain-containing protein n=1 Tax=Streptomyces sp. NPDC046931 TaxID=3154806 RepID=UPI00340B84C2